MAQARRFGRGLIDVALIDVSLIDGSALSLEGAVRSSDHLRQHIAQM
jgi:hypothetical protein